MTKTGLELEGSPEEDILNVARKATNDLETQLARSEYDQTVYELGRTAFYKLQYGDYVAIQKRTETEGPSGYVENYDLIQADDSSGKTWSVVATINSKKVLSWNKKSDRYDVFNGELPRTGSLFRFVLSEMAE